MTPTVPSLIQQRVARLAPPGRRLANVGHTIGPRSLARVPVLWLGSGQRRRLPVTPGCEFDFLTIVPGIHYTLKLRVLAAYSTVVVVYLKQGQLATPFCFDYYCISDGHFDGLKYIEVPDATLGPWYFMLQGLTGPAPGQRPILLADITLYNSVPP